jgi:hypothetical protein
VDRWIVRVRRSLEHPPWWASSAVPYPFFWVLPTVGAAIGFVAANQLGVAVWSGLLCGVMPALVLEAWWRHRRRAST